MFHVVIDINGVLIKRVWSKSSGNTKPKDEHCHVIPMPSKSGCMYIYIRPGALELLRSIYYNKNYALVFWSSMTTEYMDPIVDLLVTTAGLDGSRHVRRLSQIDCTKLKHPTVNYKPLFVKDEKRIYERYPNTDGAIFIDDSPDKMCMNEDSKIIIVKPWDGNHDDTELIDLNV